MKILTSIDLFKSFCRGIACVIAALMLVCCSEDDSVSPNPDPAPGSDKGEVSFEIGGDEGGISGTSTVEVSGGDALNIVISQKSKYTDSEGGVFECEPKASIQVSAALDTVYAESLSGLIESSGSPASESSSQGSSPVLHKTSQQFLIGGQSVSFGLSTRYIITQRLTVTWKCLT